MNKKKLGYLIQVIFIILLIAWGVWKQQHRVFEVKKSEFLMDTVFEIEVSAKLKDLESIIDSAFSLAGNYDRELSYYDEGSIISAINGAEADSAAITGEIFNMLEEGEYFYQMTGGRYDLSIGRLSDIWDIEQGTIPDSDLVAEALHYTGFDQIRYNDKNIIKPQGMKINLGSIAKGYIVDKIVEYFKGRGVSSMLINAGGDIRLEGMGEVLIGIQHPRGDRSEIIDTIRIKDQAVVTSGDYERYFEVDGVRYHHIINALTGYPARECVSVTAIAETAELADGLSTAAFLLLPEDAVMLADKLENACVIVYYLDEAGELTKMLSSGAEQYLE